MLLAKLRANWTRKRRTYLAKRLPALELPISQLCTHAQIESPCYAFWMARMKEAPRRHRKLWEFAYILQVLATRGMLAPGRRGLGFGVGTEPLPAIMARHGVTVHATDLALEQARTKGWVGTNQHAAGLDGLNNRALCPAEDFARLVTFEPLDMSDIPRHLRDFDFTWSSCCLEHLGSLESGLNFIRSSLDTLKPGGTAVHTTEFNCSSDDETVASGPVVLYRRQDILRFLDQMSAEGHGVELTLADAGDPLDRHVDVPPYSAYDHVRLQLENFVSTSIGLVIEKRR